MSQLLKPTIAAWPVLLFAACGVIENSNPAPPWEDGHAVELDFKILDAEYGDATNLIVAISTDPDRVHILETGSRRFHSISLPKRPIAVSIAPDGRRAVVVYDSLISSIDLSTHRLVATWPTVVLAHDIVLSATDLAYIFPRTDQWVSLHAINTVTGQQAQTPAGELVFEKVVARLQPGHQAVYGAWSLSPADLEKYDISQNPPRRLYDSPYHGDFAMGRNLWFTQLGDRILTSSGVILSASPDQQQDLRFIGQLPDVQNVIWATHSAVHGEFYALAIDSSLIGRGEDHLPANSISRFDDLTLQRRASINLPNFNLAVSGGQVSVRTLGYYVFAHTQQSRLFVLAKAAPTATAIDRWVAVAIPRP